MQLRKDYSYDYDTMRYFVKGCDGDLALARLALDARISAKVLKYYAEKES